MSIVLVNVFQEHETKSQLFFVQSYSQKHVCYVGHFLTLVNSM